jgi:hypothetical protein
MLIYGVPGVGKTRLIGTAPNTLIVRPPTDHTDSITTPENVDELVVDKWEQMFEAFAWLQQGATSEYEWIWLDSISLWQDHGLDDVFDAAISRNSHRAEYGPDKGEYGINMGRLQRWIRNMVGLATDGKVNFGITAHPFEWRDPVKETDVWAPWIQGKNMSPKVCGYMNEVGYMQVVTDSKTKKERRVIRFRPDGRDIVAKDQFDAFGEDGRLVDPSMEKITDAIADSRRARKPRRRRRSQTK